MKRLFEENETFSEDELDSKHTEIVNQCIDSYDSCARGSDDLKDQKRRALRTKLNDIFCSYQLLNLKRANKITQEEFERKLREIKDRYTDRYIQHHGHRYGLYGTIIQSIATLGASAIQTYGRH